MDDILRPILAYLDGLTSAGFKLKIYKGDNKSLLFAEIRKGNRKSYCSFNTKDPDFIKNWTTAIDELR